jgi:hypothetical protein
MIEVNSERLSEMMVCASTTPARPFTGARPFVGPVMLATPKVPITTATITGNDAREIAQLASLWSVSIIHPPFDRQSTLQEAFYVLPMGASTYLPSSSRHGLVKNPDAEDLGITSSGRIVELSSIETLHSACL